MLDRKFIRENVDLVKENMKKKFQDEAAVDEFLKLDEEIRSIKVEEDSLRKSRNELSKKVSQLKKAGEDASAVLEEVKNIPAKISELEEKRKGLAKKELDLLNKIPNIMHDSVPLGKDDSENVEIKKSGTIREFDFEIKNHVELIEQNDWADFDAARNVSGNGFYYLKGDLALLNQALIRFAIEHMSSKGFQYIEVPLMLRREALAAAIDENEFGENIYALAEDGLNMIGTSEHALLAMHKDRVFTESELPKKYFSYSMCFRREIGSHGINEKGLWRTHQFNKVEQFVYCKPEESWKFYDEMLTISEEFFNALELPYRVIECCSGDLATWKAKSCDMEVYRPTTKDYGEITSLTNCTDFQSRNQMTRVDYNDKEKGRVLVHTLNNTCVATSRALVGILENFQNADGTVSIPKALQPFMFGKTVMGKTE